MRRVAGGVVAVIGFILSPLSWWNDLVVNVPLALGFAWLVSWVYPSAFATAAVVGYWLTNIAGLVLLHKGAAEAARKEGKPYTRRDVLSDLGLSLLYTGLILVLVWLGVLQPVQDYLAPPASTTGP